MIDLSDGLSRDLGHICSQSKVGAMVEAALIPIHADAHELSRRDGISPLDHALNDGEDHELLFASPDTIPQATRIGWITEGSQIKLKTQSGLVPLEPKGWEHQL